MSSYTCGHCDQPSGYQGHYMAESVSLKYGNAGICPNTKASYYEDSRLRRMKVGFCCPVGHTCAPVEEEPLPEAADPSTTEAASLVGASPRMGAAGSVAAGRDVGVSSGCIAEGREGNTGSVRGLSGSLAPASDQGLLLSRRHETSHDYRGAAHPEAGIKPGHPLVTPTDDVDTVDEPANGPGPPAAGALSSSGAAGSSTVVALSALQSALLSLNAIRNALSEGTPKVLAAMTETEAALRAVSEALRRDLPPVIVCTPVRSEVTLRGEEKE